MMPILPNVVKSSKQPGSDRVNHKSRMDQDHYIDLKKQLRHYHPRHQHDREDDMSREERIRPYDGDIQKTWSRATQCRFQFSMLCRL